MVSRLLGVRIRVSKSDVDYGIRLYLPYALNEHATPCLKSAPPPLTYLILWSDADLLDEGFATYTVRG